MVAWKAASTRRAPGYRRRRPLPALAALIVLGVATIVVWVTVVHTSGNSTAGAECNAPTVKAARGKPAPQAGQVLAPDALHKTTPLPAGQIQVKVLNGGTKRGEASIVSTTLQQLGFSQAASPSDDPLYPNGGLDCPAQIRFGPNGAGAARTISLLAPCSQLVRDNRQDASVDFSIGTKFTDLSPGVDARQLLQQLAQAASQQPPQQGGQQEQGPPPSANAALISKAESAGC
ncbi:MAG: envelope integrity protein Cei [Sciscionella sp.]|nr:envelope integrity protein Cei [Sciscionella sp.]